MIVTEVRKIVDGIIDVTCYSISQNEYGTTSGYYIYCNQSKSKEEALKDINEWQNTMNRYAEILKKKVKELEK